MPATHTVLAPSVPGGPALDLLQNEAGDFRLIVSRLGAEPISLARRASPEEWRGYLHRDGDATAPCVIAGPTCDSADVLYEKLPYDLPLSLTIGDEVLIEGTGGDGVLPAPP